MPYGPFTAEVRRFLQRLATLSPTEEAAVVSEYQRTMANPEYQAAERVLGAAIARSGRERERDNLGGPLLQMLRSAPQPEPTSGTEALLVDPLNLRPIAEPALAALLVVLMQDVLSVELAARLYAPFERAIPRTALQR